MKIAVNFEIECDGKICGKCRFFDRIHYEDDVDDNCRLFKKSLNGMMSESTMLVDRLPECLAAEAELARLEEIEKEHKDYNEGCNCNDCPLNAYEACDEICETKMSLINKIAELAAELEEK